MDVRLTDEQRMLLKTAARLAVDLAPATVGDLTDGLTDGLTGGLTDERAREAAGWSALVEVGLVGLHVPAGLGGGDGRVVDVALVAEQLAGSLAPVPFVGAAVWAPTLLAAAGAHEAVEAVAAGRLRLAPVLRRDLTSLAHHGGDGIAFDARGADAGLLLDARGALRAVRLGEPTRSVDRTRTLRSVAPDAPPADLPVPLGAPLSADGLRRAHAVALAVLAADLLGVMQRALDDAVAYARQRVQFGVPVGSFQAVQHLAAHAAVLVEGARSSMWHAAWAADELPAAEALGAARQAKAFCSAAARQVGETAIQLFGGIGLTWEHLSHLRQRRTLLSRRVLGDESAQYAAIADERLTPAGRS